MKNNKEKNKENFERNILWKNISLNILNLSKQFLVKDISIFNKKDCIELTYLLKYHNDLYYNKNSPIISDFEYDILLKKLKYLEIKFNEKFDVTNIVWANIKESSFKKIKHSRPMISLDNTYNEEDLNDFDIRIKRIIDTNTTRWVYGKYSEIKEISYTLEFKFDGLWVELIYKNWNLVQAITRWNWIEWEDITENILQIENIPKSINYKNDLEIRWEVVMPISVFNILNELSKKNGEKIFSNPRNAASGSLRLLDNTVTRDRKLKFFAYDLVDTSSKNHFFIESINNSYYNLIKKIEKLWFEVSSYFKKVDWIENVIKAINSFWDIKKTIDFEIDWLVLKVENIDIWWIIGSTEHHPRYAIAYKFPAMILTTKIISVEHSVWRTWTITPVANLEPINISWVIVKRATLHNYDEIHNLDIKIWDNIFIKRAWEVIPKVISVITWERTWEEIDIVTPKKCPSCNSDVYKDDEKIRYYCPNWFLCPKQKTEKLAWCVWKQWFNIEWLWEKQIELFLNMSIIGDITDIFKIWEKQDEILALEWFKEKSVYNLLESIEKAKNIEIYKFITALWISWVWKKTAKILSSLLKTKNNLTDFSYNLEDLELLDEIWPEIANNVFTYFNDIENKKIIKELVEILNIKFSITSFDSSVSEDISQSVLFWKKICITWSFDGYKREELALKLEEVWWELMSSITKKTDYLLSWEKAGSKLKKAHELWVAIINIEEFLKKLK